MKTLVFILFVYNWIFFEGIVSLWVPLIGFSFTVLFWPLLEQQRQPLEVFYKNIFRKKVLKIYRKKHLWLSLFFDSRCFPEKFENVVITPLLQNTFGRLLLNFTNIGGKCRFQSYSFLKVHSSFLYPSKILFLPQTVLKNSISEQL